MEVWREEMAGAREGISGGCEGSRIRARVRASEESWVERSWAMG